MASRIDQIAGHAYAPGMEPSAFDRLLGLDVVTGGGESTALVVAGFVALIVLSRLMSMRGSVQRGPARRRTRRVFDDASTAPRTRPGLMRILGRTLVDDPQIRARRARDRAAEG